MNHGGEGGIRTLGTLLGYTRFPVVRLQPLGHLSLIGTLRIYDSYPLVRLSLSPKYLHGAFLGRFAELLFSEVNTSFRGSKHRLR